jgi:hypothetical protein
MWRRGFFSLLAVGAEDDVRERGGGGQGGGRHGLGGAELRGREGGQLWAVGGNIRQASIESRGQSGRLGSSARRGQALALPTACTSACTPAASSWSSSAS